MTDPVAELTDRDIGVLYALLRVYTRAGRITIRDVADEIGRGMATTHKRVGRLRQAGLVAYDEGVHGSLRPTVAAVPFRSGFRKSA